MKAIKKNILKSLLLLTLSFFFYQSSHAQCAAGFTSSETAGVVTFTNTSTGFGANSWSSWDFGDGNTGWGTATGNQTHTYANNGVYVACITAFDSLSGCTSTFCDSVLVAGATAPPPCVASFSYSVSGGTVSFSNTSSNINATTNGGWDFGDGNWANTTGSAGTSHTYTANGTYTVCLVIYSNTISCVDTICNSITITGLGGSSCAAGFTSTTSNGTAAFTNTSSNLSPGAVGYWDFGDGSFGTTSGTGNTSHTYANNGGYVVCLTVIDSSNGCSDTYCDSILISGLSGGGSNCTAGFTASEVNGVVTFTNTSTNLPAGSSGFWSFGDGTYGTIAGGAGTMHTYTANGSYVVCLTVSDSATGCQDSFCDTVSVTGVSGPSCQAGYYWFNDSLSAYTIILVNTSTGGSGLSYLWDFGDGATSTQAYPSHVYAGAGTYTVCVTISDNSGCTSVYCDTIAVTYKTNVPFSINVVGSLSNVEPEQPAIEYNAFPNPFGDRLFVEYDLDRAEDVTIELMDITGRILFSEVVENSSAGGYKHEIETAALPEGMFLLRVSTERSTQVSKVLHF